MKITILKRKKITYTIATWFAGICFYGLCIYLVLSSNLTFKPIPLGLGLGVTVILGYVFGFQAMKYDTKLKLAIKKQQL